MNIRKYSFITFALTTPLLLFNGGCSKGFLNKPALGSLVPAQITTTAGVQALLTATYAVLDGQGQGNTAIGGGNPWEATPTNWIYGSVAGGDSHKGSNISDQPPIVPIATGQSAASNGFFNNKWRALYEGVTRANLTLTTLAMSPTVKPADRTEFIAETKFLRAHYYFELRRFFNMVPWVDETTTDFHQPNKVDVYPKIEADLQSAIDSLPGTQNNVGQVNKWAAMCYLAKVYLYEAKYAQAKALYDQIIPASYGGTGHGVTSNNLPYGLTDRFEDNFDASKKNNEESVFAIQMTANDGTNSIAHANGGDMLNFPYNSPFRCCGFFQPSVDLANSYRTDATGLPLVTDYNLPANAVKNDQGISSGDLTYTPDAGNLDPRIDWTIARRGLPVHDWGLHPGNNWIRDQGSAGPYSNKKNLYWQATMGTYSDQSTWAPGSAINYCIIRFADVLLMAAECEAQLGNYGQAQTYVNFVRARAAKPANILYQYLDNSNPLKGFSTTPAAKYVIGQYATGTFNASNALQYIYFERKLELACEGHRFFDLARWGIAAQTMNAYYKFEGQITGDLTTGNFTAGKNEYYPIPQPQIDLSNGQLTQNKGY